MNIYTAIVSVAIFVGILSAAALATAVIGFVLGQISLLLVFVTALLIMPYGFIQACYKSYEYAESHP